MNVKVNLSPNILIWLLLQRNLAVVRLQVLHETRTHRLRTVEDCIEKK